MGSSKQSFHSRVTESVRLIVSGKLQRYFSKDEDLIRKVN